MITGVNSNNMNTRKYIVVVFVIADSLSDIAAGIWTPIAWLTSWHQLRLFCLRSISSWESSDKPSVMNRFRVRGNSNSSIWSSWFKCLKMTARHRSWMDVNSRLVTPSAISVLAAVLKDQNFWFKENWLRYLISLHHSKNHDVLTKVATNKRLFWMFA